MRFNQKGFSLVEALISIPLLTMTVYVSMNATSINLDFAKMMSFERSSVELKHKIIHHFVNKDNCLNFFNEINLNDRLAGNISLDKNDHGVNVIVKGDNLNKRGWLKQLSQFYPLSAEASLKLPENWRWGSTPTVETGERVLPTYLPDLVSGLENKRISIITANLPDEHEEIFIINKVKERSKMELVTQYFQAILEDYKNEMEIKELKIYGNEFIKESGPTFFGYGQSSFRAVLDLTVGSIIKPIESVETHLKIPIFFQTEYKGGKYILEGCSTDIDQYRYQMELCNSLGGTYGTLTTDPEAYKATCLVPKYNPQYNRNQEYRDNGYRAKKLDYQPLKTAIDGVKDVQ